MFDETTGKHVMMFYEGLPNYVELRTYFRDKPADIRRLKSLAIIPPNQEKEFIRFSDMSLGLAEQLQTRLGAIAAGREPPDWSDEWLYDKPYKPI